MRDHAKLPPPTLTLSRQSTERSFHRCNTKIPTWHRRSRPTLNSLPAAGAIRKLNRGDAPTTHTTFHVSAPSDGRQRVRARCFTGNIDHATHRSLEALWRTGFRDAAGAPFTNHRRHAITALISDPEEAITGWRRPVPTVSALSESSTTPPSIASHVVTVTVRWVGVATPTSAPPSHFPRYRYTCPSTIRNSGLDGLGSDETVQSTR